MLEALSGSVQASALDLSQNGIATLEFQDQHRRLHHVSTLLVGRLGDLAVCQWGVRRNRGRDGRGITWRARGGVGMQGQN